MAPRVTSSSNRNKRRSAKPPVVTTSKGRGNRSAVSTAKPTSGSNGKPSAAGARVTNASQRTNTGSARVTGTGRPALPPGQLGGALATTTKPPAARPQLSGTKPPARLPGGTGGADSVRGSGVRTGRPGAARPALPAVQRLVAPRTGDTTLSPAAARIGMGGLRGGLIAAVGSRAADVVGSALGTQLGKALKPLGRAIDDRLPGVNSKDEARRTAAKQPAKTSQPASNYEKLFDPGGGRGSYGLDKPTPVAPLPASVRQSSSGAGSSTPSRGGSTPPRGGSTSPARTAPAAPTPPSERRVSASTANRESGNYGTSKSNNPLLKGLTARMKDREDKAQASAASQLSIKPGTDSGYQPKERVDGSKVETKKKTRSTTNEYNPKKRRYGG